MAISITSTNPFLKNLSFYRKPHLSILNPTITTSLFSQKQSHISLKTPAVPRLLIVPRVAQWDTQEGESEAGFSQPPPPPPEEAKLYVGNLPFDVDSEKLANIFDAAGVVEIAEVIYNRETDRSRGFGFVTMSTVEEADKAVELLNSYDVNGRLLTVNKAAPRGSRPERPPREFAPSFRIYVGNLPWDVDNSRLEQLFSEHEKVVSARLVSDRETGRSRGFAFVSMASEAEMNEAIAALDGQTIDGRTIRVNVAEERPQRNF